ncbi:MAG TPA: hypothetical protein PK280_14030 [Planctomycetota bacterium]|nr:hypothetical protein [Planctomycetota bacterium]
MATTLAANELADNSRLEIETDKPAPIKVTVSYDRDPNAGTE